MKKSILVALLLVLALLAGSTWVLARGHRGYGGHGYGHGRGDHDDAWGPVTTSNALYAAHCGGCHLAYPPQLLPAGSWKMLLDASADHFGNDLGLTDDDKAGLLDFTTANAADRSPLKISRRIMACLDGTTPRRITDIPYIRRRHHRLDPSLFARKGIGSLANCGACHPTAAACRFDDGTIPPQ